MLKSNKETETVKMRYSESVKNERESVIIIKPKNNEEDISSEVTKRDIKRKIDISKLGLGVTKRKKVTEGAVVVGCENKTEADKLKQKLQRTWEKTTLYKHRR